MYGAIDLPGSIRTLLRLYRLFGFGHFSYNASTGKVTHSRILYCVSRLVLRVTHILSGFWLFIISSYTLGKYLQSDYRKEKDEKCGINIIFTVQMFWHLTCSHLISLQYLCCADLIVPSLNEMLKVYRRIQRLTGLDVRFSAELGMLIPLKIFLSVLQMASDVWIGIFSLAFGDVSILIGAVLLELTFWSHLYGNLVLVRFLRNMNTFLRNTDVSASRPHLAKLVAVYFRIHRLKGVINRFYSVFLLCTYFGFVEDIGTMCSTFRYYQHIANDSRFIKVRRISLHIFEGILTSFDIYILTMVGEMLTEADRELRDSLFLLENRVGMDDLGSREADLVLERCNIRNISTRMLESFVFDRKLFFFYIQEIVLSHIIICLQMSVQNKSGCKMFGIAEVWRDEKAM